MTTNSRRAFLKMVLGPALAPCLYAKPETTSLSFSRHYQATAVITFCGVTIFSKKHIGGGYAVVEQAPREGQTEVSLRFAGGSWPAKAHGVNKLGYIRELVVERAEGEPVHAEYFGFMTSAAEKSFDQARKQFAEQSTGKPVPYSAVGASATDGVWNVSVSHLMLSSRWTFSDTGELNTEIKRAMLADPDPVRSQIRFGPHTFLNSIRQALRSPADTTDHSLFYNGKAFTMRCSKQTEGKLKRLNGMLEEEATAGKTSFKLWYEPDSANYLPVKIEYKAKSFLKLIFEVDPNA